MMGKVFSPLPATKLSLILALDVHEFQQNMISMYYSKSENARYILSLMVLRSIALFRSARTKIDYRFWIFHNRLFLMYYIIHVLNHPPQDYLAARFQYNIQSKQLACD